MIIHISGRQPVMELSVPPGTKIHRQLGRPENEAMICSVEFEGDDWHKLALLINYITVNDGIGVMLLQPLSKAQDGIGTIHSEAKWMLYLLNDYD